MDDYAAARVIFAAAFGAVFAFTTWQGVKLWKGTSGGYKWAKILFAAQIPSLSVGGLSYGFYILLGFNVQIGSGVEAFDRNLGFVYAAQVLDQVEQPEDFDFEEALL